MSIVIPHPAFHPVSHGPSIPTPDAQTAHNPPADIIATYTNTENHPSLIRTRRPGEQRARLKPVEPASDGASSIAGSSRSRKSEKDEAQEEEDDDDDEDDSGSETETEARVTVSRKRGESAEERKARKANVKAERAVSSDWALRVERMRC